MSFTIASFNRYNTRIFVESDVVGSTEATGAISDIVTANLGTNKALISSGSGKIIVSGTPATKLAYLDNVTSDIQDQIDSLGSGSVSSFSAGNLVPIFTTSVATATSTPALTFLLSTQVKNRFLSGPVSGADAAPTFRVLNLNDIPIGSANQILGTNAAGTFAEHKTVSNGLTSGNGTFKLGGTLIENTEIDGGGFALSLLNSSGYNFKLKNQVSIAWTAQLSTFSRGHIELGIGSTSTQSYIDLTQGPSATGSSLILDNNNIKGGGIGIFLTDAIGVGIQYSADYSSGYTSRSLVDLGSLQSGTYSLTNKTLGSGTKILLGSDATGDIYYNGGSGTLTRLAAGTAGYVLTSAGASSAPVWSATDGVLTTSVAISSAEILTLNSSAKQLIAAPGSGKFIEILSATIYYTYGTATYTNATLIRLNHTSGSITEASDAVDLTSTASRVRQFGIGTVLTAQGFNTTVMVNSALYLRSDSSDPAVGDGTAKVYIVYRIVTA